AKRTPAMGALKEAEIALATPAPKRVRRHHSGRLARHAIAVARTAPRWTTGPSRPALAPEPSDRAVTKAESRPSRNLSFRPDKARASMTSATAPVRRA